MRICFFADARNRHVRRLAPGLANRGHQVHCVGHKPLDLPGVTSEVYRVPPPGLSMPYRWLGRREAYLRTFLCRFDVVVVYFLHDWGFRPEWIGEGCFVASPRGSDIVPPPGESPPTADLVAERIAILRNAALVGVAGPSFAQIVAKHAGLSPEQIGLLPLGVDLQQFNPLAESDRPRDSLRRVGFFKGFREVYGAVDLVRAIPIVAKRLPDVRFDFVGEGPTLPNCRRLAEKLGVSEKCQWLAPVMHEKIPELLRGWMVTAMPSRCESFGLAALESAAMTVPVVAYDVGGIRDTVQDGKSGLLAPPGDVEALAQGLLRLLSDEELRQRLGNWGREWVRDQFEWGAVLRQWEESLLQARERVSIAV
ncbi:MAG: glycosyltransferase family 4 protein [Planctomycetota bacterium]